jgi:lipopolysaccharide transport system ATP-binding protein
MTALTARFDGVWKSYPRWLPGRRSLRAMASPRIRATGRRSGSRWALRDVSLELRAGEGVGLIGANGAGKSTLLRLASGLGRPTRGTIGTASDVASVLTLGAAFNGDLTGRENALTATMLAGMPIAQARATVPAALAFAELEPFADAPVRSYSDGMKLRLAFGVVAQLSPRLLLLDEVIAVGDLRFQEKCMARIVELREGGTSFLFASHDLEQVTEQCDRALWLDGGEVRAWGPVEDVVTRYREAMHVETFERTPVPEHGEADEELVLQRNRFGSQEVTIEEVRIVGDTSSNAVEPDGSLAVDLTLRHAGPAVHNPIVGISIYRARDDVLCCEANTDGDDVLTGALAGELTVRFRWDDVELAPGEYVIDVGVFEAGWAFAYDYHWHVYPLKVRSGSASSKAVYRMRRRSWTVER